jgi:hypothetical protein
VIPLRKLRLIAGGGGFAPCMLEEWPVLHFGSKLCDLSFQTFQALRETVRSFVGRQKGIEIWHRLRSQRARCFSLSSC